LGQFLLQIGLGISFTPIAAAIAPNFPHLPIFELLDRYYATDEAALAEAKAFYLVNYSIYFPASAILIACTIVETWYLCRSPRYLTFIPTQRIPTIQAARPVAAYSSIGTLLLIVVVYAGLTVEQIRLYTLPEQGIGRGLLIVGELFGLFLPLAASTVIAVLYHFKFTFKENKP
jgi:hypothetical protein